MSDDHDTLAYLTETEPWRVLRAAARIADHIHDERDTRPAELRALADQLEEREWTNEIRNGG